MSANRDSVIRDHAYRLWENEGRPEGRDLDFWLIAEAQVKTVAAPAPAASAPVKAVVAKPKAAARVKAKAKA
jgi:hypothetical protein